MRSSPRRPLILRRRRLNLPNQDDLRSTRTPEQRQTAMTGTVESQKKDLGHNESILPKSVTTEFNRFPENLVHPNQSTSVGNAASPADSPSLCGVKVMGHPTIPDTQLVVIPPDSDVESIIQALTVRGKESGGPNKFILITGSSSFHSQVEKLGLQSKAAEEIETIQLEASSSSHQSPEEEKHAVPKEGQELDGSLTNIHWLGNMSSDGLGPCDVKVEFAEKENCTPGMESLQVEEEHSAPAASQQWQVSAFERPPYSYMALIQFAINSTTSKRMTLKDIYTWIEDHFPYFKHVAKPGWKNSIRHNLSLHDMFVRETSSNNKISYWTIHPHANRCLTLDQVYKASSSTSSACTEPQQKRLLPELSKTMPSVPSSTKAPERKMKPLLPRVDSYLIPVQFPLTQSLMFSPVETFSPDPGASDGPHSSKRVKIAPKVLLESEQPSLPIPAAPEQTELDSTKMRPSLLSQCQRISGSRRKQQLVTPRSQEPELVLPDTSFSDSGLDTDISILQDTKPQEAPSELTQDEGYSFKTPVKERLTKPPASSTPSKPTERSFLPPAVESESPLTRDPLSEFSPVRIPRGPALTPFKDSYGTLSFWETPFKDLPYFGSPPDLMGTSPPLFSQSETLETPTGARKHRGCSKELQVGGSTNRSLLEGLVLDTKDESLSKILLDVSFSGLEEDNCAGTDSSYWGQLFNELR
ncbi:LOW QUALITY PROTEIN: forkhead box protein M1 [Bufo gargarizans]|uniref:LOW QUALITY PROTEIN: forkhead box protein M1 n=1 Tax=Bufo gargarizans TaxID=30331 RepID=UPI001CF1992D|nr:LOW QUALITY PROTEIN: forkhead box protein M1 [Bufo gargarizans]